MFAINYPTISCFQVPKHVFSGQIIECRDCYSNRPKDTLQLAPYQEAFPRQQKLMRCCTSQHWDEYLHGWNIEHRLNKDAGMIELWSRRRSLMAHSETPCGACYKTPIRPHFFPFTLASQVTSPSALLGEAKWHIPLVQYVLGLLLVEHASNISQGGIQNIYPSHISLLLLMWSRSSFTLNLTGLLPHLISVGVPNHTAQKSFLLSSGILFFHSCPRFYGHGWGSASDQWLSFFLLRILCLYFHFACLKYYVAGIFA